jgi:hypothetical protein
MGGRQIRYNGNEASCVTRSSDCAGTAQRNLLIWNFRMWTTARGSGVEQAKDTACEALLVTKRCSIRYYSGSATIYRNERSCSHATAQAIHYANIGEPSNLGFPRRNRLAVNKHMPARLSSRPPVSVHEGGQKKQSPARPKTKASDPTGWLDSATLGRSGGSSRATGKLSDLCILYHVYYMPTRFTGHVQPLSPRLVVMA